MIKITEFALNILKKYWLLITTMLLIGITYLSLYPLAELPDVPGSDKTHHLISYGLLAYPSALRRQPGWKYIIFCFALYSGVIELIQPYVNRYGEWEDFTANLMGLAIGVWLAAITDRLNKARTTD